MPFRKNQINREARGFLDLFRAKTGGVQPQTIADNVQPIVDMESYLSGALLQNAFNTSSNGVSPTATVTVPSDETWLVYSVSAASPFFSAAAAECRTIIVSTIIPGSTQMLLGVDRELWTGNVVTQFMRNSLVWVPPKPYLARPGTAFKAEGKYTTAGSIQVYCLYAALNV